MTKQLITGLKCCWDWVEYVCCRNVEDFCILDQNRLDDLVWLNVLSLLEHGGQCCREQCRL